MSLKNSISSFGTQCLRVLKVSKKPDTKEYTETAKVTAIGMLLIGAIGFIFSFIATLLS